MFADTIIQKINHYRHELTNEVRTATNKKRKAIKLQKDSLINISNKLQVSHSSVERVIAEGSQKKTMASKRQMLQQLQLAHDEFDMDLLKPIESYDVKFECNSGNPLDGLGTINCTHLHKKFLPKGEALKWAHTLSDASFKIELIKGEDLIGALPVSMVTVEIAPYTVISPLKLLSPGVFKVTYMPIKCGTHKISIKIGGEEVDNSPFTVHILQRFERVEIPLSSIMILGPRGICVGRNSSIVVSEYPSDEINEHIKLAITSDHYLWSDDQTEKEHFTILKKDRRNKERHRMSIPIWHSSY